MEGGAQRSLCDRQFGGGHGERLGDACRDLTGHRPAAIRGANAIGWLLGSSPRRRRNPLDLVPPGGRGMLTSLHFTAECPCSVGEDHLAGFNVLFLAPSAASKEF